MISNTNVKINDLDIKSSFKGPLSFCSGKNNSLLVVDEINHEISCHDEYGNLKWKKGELYYPTDCCFDGESFWITDRYNHRIISFDENGNIICSFGKYGDNNDELNEPFGISAIKERKQLIVADSENHKVKIFSFDGTLIKSIGTQGAGAEYYESDYFKKQTVFKKWISSQSRFQTIESLFFKSRFTLGNMEFPKGVGVLNDFIVVADFVGRIQIFDFEGNLIKSFYDYKYPEWIFIYDDEIYFNGELSGSIWKITKDFEVIPFITLKKEIGKFSINNNCLTFLSPWEKKLYSINL